MNCEECQNFKAKPKEPEFDKEELKLVKEIIKVHDAYCKGRHCSNCVFDNPAGACYSSLTEQNIDRKYKDSWKEV